ncbi:high affinity nickel transport protein nic1 [Aulographum hederae CBS 113979]|uniref:Nickel/cobalt efflux system n=1 Tax=Aulographum hederae CBS 113979 TaxID=1176131 RepID=A0A6G1GX57_9PEZI|nr:high affinity nickel transport protein nic1 [Aulographum hederae CBS 113979]
MGVVNQAAAVGRRWHASVPFVRKLPAPVVGINLLIVLINLIAWTIAGIVLSKNRGLLGSTVLAYTLGLRHALDADHITAIDLMTRRLIAAGQRPISVGTFFSLGHSTIVIITSIAVAATAAALTEKFDTFSRVGGIIGTSVSATFLILLGTMNAYLLVKQAMQLKQEIVTPPGESTVLDLGGGCLVAVFKKAFRLIDRPWKMYPLGILFGLGFDTSSEVALLGITSVQASRGMSMWCILILPLIFTSGMCLLDTLDGSLMSALYTSPTFAHDTIAILFFSVALNLITVIVAITVGVLQLLLLVLKVEEPTGKFWEGVEAAGDSYDIIGGSIVGAFVVLGALSLVIYRPWRKRVDARRVALFGRPEDNLGVEGSSLENMDTRDEKDKEIDVSVLELTGSRVERSSLAANAQHRRNGSNVQ